MEQTMEVDEDSRLEMNADVDQIDVDLPRSDEVSMSTDDDSNSIQNSGAASKSGDVAMLPILPPEAPTEMETDPIGVEVSAVAKVPEVGENDERAVVGDGITVDPSESETIPSSSRDDRPEREDDNSSEDNSRGKAGKADSGEENGDPLWESESDRRTPIAIADKVSNSFSALDDDESVDSPAKPPRSPDPAASGKSLADELSDVGVQSGKSGLKAVEADHISLGSSEPGVDIGVPDHVSIASSDDDAPSHVSVDSDSETEASKPTDEDDGSKNPDHTAPVDDLEVEATQSKENGSSSRHGGQPDARKSDHYQSTLTDAVEVSDDEGLLDPKAPALETRGMITLLKTSDTEMITSDGPAVRVTSSAVSDNIHAASLNRARCDKIITAQKSQYSVKKLPSSVFEKCLYCSVNHMCPWKVSIAGVDFYVCSDKCLEAHRAQREQLNEKGAPPVSTIIQITDLSGLLRECVYCGKDIPRNKLGSLTWEVMEFCDEDCLAKYQLKFTSKCCKCQSPVASSAMGKYCVRFGHDVKQFCSSSCLDTYKKGVKACSYCQKDLQNNSEGFLAPVGGKDQFRDFCSPSCLERYDCISNKTPLVSYSVAKCVVCDNVKVTLYELLIGSKVATLCSDVCLAAYKFVNDIAVGVCSRCNKYYDKKSVDECITFNNDVPSSFCSKHCMNVEVIKRRKIVPCVWCKAKKYNFDMICQKVNADDEGMFVCSVNCLALHNVSTKPLPPKKVPCSYCKNVKVSAYHMTMSDASIRYFCHYDCVKAFQAPFNTSITSENTPVPTGVPLKVINTSPVTTNNGPTIQSFGTLKPLDVPPLVNQSTPKSQNKLKPTTLKIPSSFSYKPSEMKNRWTQISARHENKSVSCRPKVFDRGTQCSPDEITNGEGSALSDTIPKEASTGNESSIKAIVPIPVPIYVPYPCAMYTLPSPVPLAVPVPIVVPLIVPTSLDNMERVIDTMKEILEKSAQRTDAGASSSCNDMRQPALNSTTDSTRSIEQRETSETGSRKRGFVDNSLDNVNLIKRPRREDDDGGSSPEPDPREKQIKFKYILGLRVWNQFVKRWNEELEASMKPMKTDLLEMRPQELNDSLTVFVREMKKHNGSEYKPDVKFYVCLGLQFYLSENGRVDDIFGEATYDKFTNALDEEAQKFHLDLDRPTSKVEEEHLWECMLLGPKTPYVLLTTLMYFITLHFNLRTVEEHMQLSFHSFRRVYEGSSLKVVKLVLYSDEYKPKEYELVENEEDPTRCPIKFFEFYLTKCPPSVTSHKDWFYLLPNASCPPESPVWYQTIGLDSRSVEKMLNRIKLIKEICDSRPVLSEQSNVECSS